MYHYWTTSVFPHLWDAFGKKVLDNGDINFIPHLFDIWKYGLDGHRYRYDTYTANAGWLIGVNCMISIEKPLFIFDDKYKLNKNTDWVLLSNALCRILKNALKPCNSLLIHCLNTDISKLEQWEKTVKSASNYKHL